MSSEMFSDGLIVPGVVSDVELLPPEVALTAFGIAHLLQLWQTDLLSQIISNWSDEELWLREQIADSLGCRAEELRPAKPLTDDCVTVFDTLGHRETVYAITIFPVLEATGRHDESIGLEVALAHDSQTGLIRITSFRGMIG